MTERIFEEKYYHPNGFGPMIHAFLFYTVHRKIPFHFVDRAKAAVTGKTGLSPSLLCRHSAQFAMMMTVISYQ
jgi:hypothetical protein